MDFKGLATENENLIRRFSRPLSDIFIPVIPVIVASGLLMGLLNLLVCFGIIADDDGIYQLLRIFSDSVFAFLPVIIAFSAAKRFGCNPYLAAVLGGMMIHPELLNAWDVGRSGSKIEIMNIFGFNMEKVGYQGTVLPVIFAIWFMSFLEKHIKKIMPAFLDFLLTPFFTLLLSAAATFFVIGPVGRRIGDGMAFLLVFLYDKLSAVSGIIFGGLYSLIVITGSHHSFHAVETTLIASSGANFLLPVWAMANAAQGGACLGAYFKTNDKKIRISAVPASISCLLGITEAAIFGVNLKLVKPFIAAMVGGAVGGFFVVLTGVSMKGIGVTGIPGAAICTDTHSMIMYTVGMFIAFAVSFTATVFMKLTKTK